MPRAPRNPDAVARRNVKVGRADLPPAKAVAAPPFPKELTPHPLVLEWWTDVWSSPQATRYSATEKHQCYVVAALLGELYLRPTERLAGQIRVFQRGLGLDQEDRNRLQWRMDVEPAEEPKPARAPRGKSKPATPAKPARRRDPRRRGPNLYVVGAAG